MSLPAFCAGNSALKKLGEPPLKTKTLCICTCALWGCLCTFLFHAGWLSPKAASLQFSPQAQALFANPDTAFITISLYTALLVIGVLLCTACVIDYKTMILPDVLTLPAAAIAFPTSALLQGNGWNFALAGSGVGAGFLLSVAIFYSVIRKRQGLGMGDVKLMLSVGALTGPEGALSAILTGSVTMLLVTLTLLFKARLTQKKGVPTFVTPYPFGPFLWAGGLVEILFQIK